MSRKKMAWLVPAGIFFMALVIISVTLLRLNGLASSNSQTVDPAIRAQNAEIEKSSSSIGEQAGLPVAAVTQADIISNVSGLSTVEPEKDNTNSNDAAMLESLRSPVQGEIIRPAGNYYSAALQGYLFHAGTDYSEPEGTVIRANREGLVTFAGPDPILGGKVTIDCGGDWSVTFGSLENLSVKQGDKVKKGTILGQVAHIPGSEGQNRPQLHYEVWKGDNVQTP
ncbi:MAG: M23 family metallopeptidase [Desulfitobacteriaceae bacterium]